MDHWPKQKEAHTRGEFDGTFSRDPEKKIATRDLVH